MNRQSHKRIASSIIQSRALTSARIAVRSAIKNYTFPTSAAVAVARCGQIARASRDMYMAQCLARENRFLIEGSERVCTGGRKQGKTLERLINECASATQDTVHINVHN